MPKLIYLNNSSPMNNTVTKKIKHFPQFIALGPQIALKRKLHCFLSRSTINIKLNVCVYKYKDGYICSGLLQPICSVTRNI